MTRSRDARLAYRGYRPGLLLEEHAGYTFATALRVRLTPESRDLTIVGVHLPSRLYRRNEADEWQHADICRTFVEDQEQPVERGGVGHDRTLVIGDFNLDPYSPAMVGIAGLNAMMTPRPTRRSAGRSRAAFYNPCGTPSVTAQLHPAPTICAPRARWGTIGTCSTKRWSGARSFPISKASVWSLMTR